MSNAREADLALYATPDMVLENVTE